MCVRHAFHALQATITARFSAAWRGSLRVAIAAAVLTLFAAGPAAAENQPLTIRFSTHIRPEVPNFTSMKFFKDRVEQASGGRIIIDIRHSGELYGDGQIAGAVTSGAVEMGYANLSRYTGAVPIADAFQLPFVFNTEELSSAATAPGSEIRTLIEKELANRAGTRVLWWVPLGQTVFLTNGMSVADPDTLAGKTVRTLGPVSEALVRQCGGVPRNIDGQDQEKAYQNREVDVGQAGITTFAGRKLWRFMDTITRTNHTIVQFVVVINEKYWQSLSAEQRAILTDAALAADAEARANCARIEASAYREAAEDKGVKVVSLSEDELKRWRICSSNILEWFLERSGAEGQELMLAYGRMRKGSGNPFLLPLNPIAAKRAPAAPQGR